MKPKNTTSDISHATFNQASDARDYAKMASLKTTIILIAVVLHFLFSIILAFIK